MLKNIKIITITHRDLNVNDLEMFVIKSQDKADLKATLTSIKSQSKMDELMYLSTCNRVLYLCSTNEDLTDEYVKDFLSLVNPEFRQQSNDLWKKFVKVFEGKEAVNHIFSVASSLDSLVVGEREIIRQFRNAYADSKDMELTGDDIRLLEEYTVQAAKAVYSQTKIGEKPVSIVSLAIQKILKANILPTSRVLLIGAGETIQLVSKFLKKLEFSNVAIFNRSIDNAKVLSDSLQAEAFHLSEIKNYRDGFDCMIACTGATEAVITNDIYKALVGIETDKKLVVDLSVPNNVDRSIGKSYPVDLVDIEILRELAKENLQYRQEEVKVAKTILQAHVNQFSTIYQQRQIEKSLKHLPQEINAIKERAIEKVFEKELESLDDGTQQLIHEMMDYMAKKCVGIPMKMAKDAIK